MGTLENSKKCLYQHEESKQGNDNDMEDKVFKSFEEERKDQEKLGAISKR